MEENIPEEFDKLYYRISDVSEILGVPATTLRYWETEFKEINPKRSGSNRRYYSPDDIRILRMISYLVKTKGLRIDAAKEELRSNRKNISRHMEVIDLLTDTRAELQDLLSALNKRR